MNANKQKISLALSFAIAMLKIMITTILKALNSFSKPMLNFKLTFFARIPVLTAIATLEFTIIITTSSFSSFLSFFILLLFLHFEFRFKYSALHYKTIDFLLPVLFSTYLTHCFIQSILVSVSHHLLLNLRRDYRHASNPGFHQISTLKALSVKVIDCIKGIFIVKGCCNVSELGT